MFFIHNVRITDGGIDFSGIHEYNKNVICKDKQKRYGVWEKSSE